MKLPEAKRILVLQTAFIGDVILATALLEKLHIFYPQSQIDILVRKGNESLFENHPYLNKVLIWEKKQQKLKNMLAIIGEIRKGKYNYLINCQRFLSSGLFTIFSGAKFTVGFDKNPLSFLFNKSIKHEINGLHETERNQKLIEFLTDSIPSKPKLYPPSLSTLTSNFSLLTSQLSSVNSQLSTFITISPASVWFTKQYPVEKWIEFINKIPQNIAVVLLGGKTDTDLCQTIADRVQRKDNIFIQAGKLSLLESAALMKAAVMNYVNDSAPMHLCSAVNAPVCAVYCSTVPEFGFGPLSERSFIVQYPGDLYCRPCGLHGHKQCPEEHFKCALDIDIKRLLDIIPENP